jgi:ABC-2 type transport system permease protein
MTTSSNGMPAQSHATTASVVSPVQRLYWSVRRELWETRSIYLAPLAAAGLALAGFLISLAHLPAKIRAA